jgi:hypothetical protein
MILSGAHKKSIFGNPLTTAVIGTCVWAGVDSVWEQENAEARKMLENAAESHTSGARFVGTLLTFEDSLPLKDLAILLLAFDNILFFFG